MTPFSLPPQTLAWLNQAADAGQCDAQIMLHLLNRVYANDRDVANFLDRYSRFLGSYSKTIAALCCRLDVLERGANLHKQDEDVKVAQSNSVADAVQRITDHAAKAGLAAASTPLPAALVERVASAMGPSTQAAMDDGEMPFGTASAAICEVAAWLDTRGQHGCSALLREEIDQ